MTAFHDVCAAGSDEATAQLQKVQAVTDMSDSDRSRSCSRGRSRSCSRNRNCTPELLLRSPALNSPCLQLFRTSLQQSANKSPRPRAVSRSPAAACRSPRAVAARGSYSASKSPRGPTGSAAKSNQGTRGVDNENLDVHATHGRSGCCATLAKLHRVSAPRPVSSSVAQRTSKAAAAGVNTEETGSFGPPGVLRRSRSGAAVQDMLRTAPAHDFVGLELHGPQRPASSLPHAVLPRARLAQPSRHKQTEPFQNHCLQSHLLQEQKEHGSLQQQEQQQLHCSDTEQHATQLQAGVTLHQQPKAHNEHNHSSLQAALPSGHLGQQSQESSTVLAVPVKQQGTAARLAAGQQPLLSHLQASTSRPHTAASEELAQAPPSAHEPKAAALHPDQHGHAHAKQVSAMQGHQRRQMAEHPASGTGLRGRPQHPSSLNTQQASLPHTSVEESVVQRCQGAALAASAAHADRFPELEDAPTVQKLSVTPHEPLRQRSGNPFAEHAQAASVTAHMTTAEHVQPSGHFAQPAVGLHLCQQTYGADSSRCQEDHADQTVSHDCEGDVQRAQQSQHHRHPLAVAQGCVQLAAAQGLLDSAKKSMQSSEPVKAGVRAAEAQAGLPSQTSMSSWQVAVPADQQTCALQANDLEMEAMAADEEACLHELQVSHCCAQAAYLATVFLTAHCHICLLMSMLGVCVVAS